MVGANPGLGFDKGLGEENEDLRTGNNVELNWFSKRLRLAREEECRPGKGDDVVKHQGMEELEVITERMKNS